MNEPIISYSAKLAAHETYKDLQEIYGGTLTDTVPIEIDIRIWNNKYGTEQVEDLENFVLNIFFDKYEDANLLKFTSLIYNNTQNVPISISDNVATATFLDDVIIKGTPNNGEEADENNYIDLKLVFKIDDEDIYLKEQDLKSLYLEIVKQ